MDVAEFTREALEAVAKNEDIIIIPSWWKRIWRLERLSPSRMIKLAQKQYEEGFKLLHQKS